jgi:putative peptidoglycan lipid II flippase
LLSRIAGLVRDRVFAHYLGNSDAAGAFRAALRIPNFLQNLFGEGVLSASFIPVYARLRASGDKQLALQVAGVVGAVLALGVAVLVLLGVLLTPYLVDLVAPGFEGELRNLTVEIVQILFPGVGLLVLSAWCLGILNSHRKFFVSYAAPVFWNLALIGTLIIYGHRSEQTQLVVYLAWGSVLGSLLQFGVQWPFVYQAIGLPPLSLKISLSPVREIFRNLLPVLLGRGVVQVSAYVDSMIASYLGAAAVASLAYAQTIYLLPVSLFGMAVAAAELPEMSEQAADSTFEKLRIRIVRSRRQIAFFIIPSEVLIFFLGRWVVQSLYQTGQFGTEDTLYVWYILMGSVVGLLAATWGRLYSSVFYALRDTRTPLKFALLRVTITVLLGLLLAFPLRPYISQVLWYIPGLRLPLIANAEVALGAVGLTLAAALAGCVEYLCLERSLRKRIGPTPVPQTFLVKTWLAALFAAAIALGAEQMLSKINFSIRIYNFEPLIMIGIYGLLFLLLAIALKLDEAKFFVRRLLK